MKLGIGLVSQHFHLARRHTVAENIGLGLTDTPFFFPTRALEQQITELSEHYGLPVDPKARIWQLSPGEQQRVEIIKALLRGARILILDEPTSVLTPQEIDNLFRVLMQMKAEGKALIFISHKLDEVMRIADAITVLRKGAVVGNLEGSEASLNKLARLMVGREVSFSRQQERSLPGEVAVRLRGVSVRSVSGLEALKDVSFDIHHGEILGVAGVAGNGQGELIEVLTGLHRPNAGNITLDGRDITPLGARGLFESGVAHIPEDRNHMGIVPAMSVAENLVLRQYRYQPFARGIALDWGKITRFARDAIERYEIAAPSKDTVARLLSGGNVQKLILARELSGEPKLVVAAHPTYGLDVSATALTHKLLQEQRARGAGVLLVSEDLDELLRLSDRILVLFSGRVMGVIDADDADREEIGLMMAGIADGGGASQGEAPGAPA